MSKVKARPDKAPSVSSASGTATDIATPTLPAKKPPPILPPNMVGAGLNSTNGLSRNAARVRREASAQMGRGQRNACASAKGAGTNGTDAQTIYPQPQPYGMNLYLECRSCCLIVLVRTDAYILKKYRDSPASLVVHLHPTHFRFDQQDGTFSYKSPMKIFIEHLRDGTVPHDLLEYFDKWNVAFYEGS